MAAALRPLPSRPARPPLRELGGGAKRAISDAPKEGDSLATSLEWDTQVVQGSSPLGPAGLRAGEPPSGPRLPSWLRPERCAVLQCAGCHAVLADSVHLAWDLTSTLGAVVFSREWRRCVQGGPAVQGGRGQGIPAPPPIFRGGHKSLPGVGGPCSDLLGACSHLCLSS